MVVGITGSIATGKSLVTNYLIEHHYKVIDCDLISHQVLELDVVLNEISKHFPNVIQENKVNRQALGYIIFYDSLKQEELEKIVMPYIVAEIKKQITNDSLIFLDAPTLLENDLLYLVDKLIVVKVEQEIQIQRLMARDNISKQYAIKKIASQWPLEKKLTYANYVIDNSYSIENTYEQIHNILCKIKESTNET